MVCGIDYGSKMAGTTSICYIKAGVVKIERSAKKQDADAMIQAFCQRERPELIALDAPLSLPGVYTAKEGFQDYFYRVCDKELKAMSPMFLGGLTARAIKLKAMLSEIKIIEAYPVFRAKALELHKFGYRGKTPEIKAILNKLGGVFATAEILSSHDMDALLCLEIGQRFLQNKTQRSGLVEEGVIYY